MAPIQRLLSTVSFAIGRDASCRARILDCPRCDRSSRIRRATSGVDRFLVLADTKTDESNPFAGISPVINPASTTDAQE